MLPYSPGMASFKDFKKYKDSLYSINSEKARSPLNLSSPRSPRIDKDLKRNISKNLGVLAPTTLSRIRVFSDHN